MPSSFEALGVLLILLPGFSCSYIAQALTTRARRTELDKIIEALVFSCVLYGITIPFFGATLPVSWRIESPSLYTVQLHQAHLITLVALAIGGAILYSACLEHDWLLIPFRKLHITEKTTRPSIWIDAFQDIAEDDCYLMVGISRGRTVLGYLSYYSDDPDESSIFLEDAAWLKENGDQQPIDGPGILLTKQSGIEYVAFLYPAEEEEESENSEPSSSR
jgi:hypothetical protein